MQRNALPASVAAALGSEVSPTWLPRGPSGNLRALNKLHSLPPSTHRMCFLLTRQPNRASYGCVLVQVSFEERRGSTHSLECIAHSKVRCISSEAAPNRSALAGIIINTGETPGKHRGNTGETPGKHWENHNNNLIIIIINTQPIDNSAKLFIRIKQSINMHVIIITNT